MLGFEMVVELLRDLFNVESAASAACDIYEGKALLLIQRELDGLQLLNEPLATLAFMMASFAACGRTPCFALDPLPYLHGFRRVGIDDDVFPNVFGYLLIDLAANGIGGKIIILHPTLKRDHSPFVRCGDERKYSIFNGDIKALCVLVPSGDFEEEGFEVGVENEGAGFFLV